MEKLEAFLINLFMWGESCSAHGIRDTTILQCEGFVFEFKQHNIHLKQNEYLNKTIITTTITVQNIVSEQVSQVLEIIDDFCWLLSFTQQSPVHRCGHKIDSAEHWTNCSGIVINPPANIIESRGGKIRDFIEQVYPAFKELKSSRQLPVVFGYLCEAKRGSLALEASLILHYVLIENLKHTFALSLGFKYKNTHYKHPNYPPLNKQPQDSKNYNINNKNQYIHKFYGECGSTEMTKRMFEANGIHRSSKVIKITLNKRNTMIHEGVLLPVGDPNYFEQAYQDFCAVNDLIKEYLLRILGYKGEYFLNKDRFTPSGIIE